MIDAWFDYTSPLSMLTRHLLSAKLGNSGTRIRWHPADGGYEALDPVWFTQAWDRSVRPLAERLGVRVNAVPPRPTSARLALQGYQYALDQGLAEAYSDQVFHAYFVQRADIGEPQALGMAAHRAGLDPERFRSAATSAHYAERHRAAVTQSPPVRVTPTVMCGGYRIEGVPNDAQLARLVAASATSRARVDSPRVAVDRTADPWSRKAGPVWCAAVGALDGDFPEFTGRGDRTLGKRVEQSGVCGAN
jgi:predicted DsbA family dithiol-disulfide isomerase